MNEFLKRRSQVDLATHFLQHNGYVESGISCKNWEISEVIPYMKDGNWLDMGSDGSVVLPNLLKKNITGVKVGVDLAYKENPPVWEQGVNLIPCDLTSIPLPDKFFDFIVSLSTIEHQVDFELFAKEVSRLLMEDGKLFVSFDYWEPKPDTSKMKLYSLDWNILDKNDVINLVDKLGQYGLEITKPIDWALQDAVITPQYCSPAKDVSYTFGIFSFVKANL